METRLDRITKVMSQARKQKRQVWILDALIDIWDAEALKKS
jgi:hypothetical protein